MVRRPTPRSTRRDAAFRARRPSRLDLSETHGVTPLADAQRQQLVHRGNRRAANPAARLKRLAGERLLRWADGKRSASGGLFFMAKGKPRHLRSDAPINDALKVQLGETLQSHAVISSAAR